MFRRELFFADALAAAIFMMVAGTGWLAVHKLHGTSRMLVVDTLPGLAGQRMHYNRHTKHEMLFPHRRSKADGGTLDRVQTKN